MFFLMILGWVCGVCACGVGGAAALAPPRLQGGSGGAAGPPPLEVLLHLELMDTIGGHLGSRLLPASAGGEPAFPALPEPSVPCEARGEGRYMGRGWFAASSPGLAGRS